MTESLKASHGHNIPKRLELGIGEYVISGVFDPGRNLVWVDDIDLPQEGGGPNTVDPRAMLKDFAQEAQNSGATELRFVCPRVKDLQLLSHVFDPEKLRFYQTTIRDGEQEQSELTKMKIEQATESLQEIESLQTVELFSTDWFDVGVDIRA